MNCAGCDTPLQRHEHAQPTLILGVKCYPRSFCRNCLTPWLGGTEEAHQRLRNGTRDKAELARIGEVVATWQDNAA